ncbi:hypothetical protein DFJ74DRAFT_686481 [Hyaloraphidium curvatum]|nr:hypothetical protein DFJ74DRAFT_686481 [Hyaloraphidium curvatum]
MARWLQLVSRGGAGANGEEVALLKHDPKDDLCPCPAVSCAGRLPWLAGVARFGEASYKLVIFLLYLVLTIAALAIFPPMSPRIWATPWSAFLIALYMLLALALGVPLAFGRFSTNLPLLQLSRRVTRRAMKLALTPMVQRYREAADAKIAAWPGSARRERAGYMDLHSLLSRTWRNRIRGYSTTSPMIIPVSTAVIFALVSMAVGGCLPALYLGYLGYILVAHLLTDLVHVAASNDLVSDIRALYLDAASELASLRRELTSAPAAEPADPALLAAIEADVDVLAGFTDADRYRARFLGFVVTFGTVRTLLVTAVTLGIGLWSVLRNLGVVLAGDLVCPPRGA